MCASFFYSSVLYKHDEIQEGKTHMILNGICTKYLAKYCDR